MNHDILSAKNVIILSPHPDDEALGCSGTVTILNKRGISVDIVYLTKGERLYGEPSEEIARMRVEEAKKASLMLGCEDAIFLDLPDGGLDQCSGDLYQTLKKLLGEKMPDLILSPSFIDYHQDHITTAKVSLKLLNDLNTFRLAFYEIYQTIRFNQLVDISEVVDVKERVILNYKKSLYDKPDVYVHASLGLNAQRSIFTQKKGFYEALFVIDKPIDEENVYNYLCYR